MCSGVCVVYGVILGIYGVQCHVSCVVGVVYVVQYASRRVFRDVYCVLYMLRGSFRDIDCVLYVTTPLTTYGRACVMPHTANHTYYTTCHTQRTPPNQPHNTYQTAYHASFVTHHTSYTMRLSS